MLKRLAAEQTHLQVQIKHPDHLHSLVIDRVRTVSWSRSPQMQLFTSYESVRSKIPLNLKEYNEYITSELKPNSEQKSLKTQQ